MPDVSKDTDHELIARVSASHDRDAFRELYRRYAPLITRYASKLLPMRTASVDDVVQETFVRMYERAAAYRPVGSFSGWLYRIAYNLSMDVHRTRTIPSDMTEQYAHTSASAEDTFFADDRVRRLRTAIDALPHDLRSIVLAKVYIGMTFPEASEFLRVPLRTLKHRFQRALQYLGNALGNGEGT